MNRSRPHFYFIHMVNTAGVMDDDWLFEQADYFHGACGSGRLEDAKRCMKYYDSNRREMTSNREHLLCNEYIDINWALTQSCERGHLEVAQWLVATFRDVSNITDAALRQRAEFNVEDALRAAVDNKAGAVHWNVIKWLLVTFPAELEGWKTDQDLCLFQTAGGCGNLEMAKWLINNHLNFEDHTLDHALSVAHYSRIKPDIIYWLLGFYTAEQFWTDRVQKCHSFVRTVTDWRAGVEPRRAAFMRDIAPLIESRRAREE